MSKVADAVTATGGTTSTDKIQEIKDKVLEATKDFDPNEEEKDENLEFHETEASSMGDLFHRYASTGGLVLLYNGLFWSFVFGAALPAFCVVFGELIDDMGNMEAQSQEGFDEDAPHPMQENSVTMLYVAAGVFVASAVYIASLAVFSEGVEHKFKIDYFTKALEKDAAFYDVQNPNEMASKINKEAGAVKKGTCEKIGALNMSMASVILGFAAAFYFGWKYSLVLLGGMPVMMATGVMWGMAMEAGTVEQMKAYAQSAGYAEQALQSIKIVQTYGNEKLELGNYSKYLGQARAKQRVSSLKSAVAYAALFSAFFAFYAYALYFGGYVRWNKWTLEGETDQYYTGGKVVSIMFCIVFGAMMIGAGGPAMVAISQGRVAMCLALKVIDKVPDVDPNDKKRNGVLPENINGEIHFEKVNFRYPTRPDLHVLKDFTCTFEAGKTTALVGPSGSGKSTIIQMIERFYKQESGKITIDGTDIDTLNLRNFRQRMGYVGQEPVLFNATIRENMHFAVPGASDEDIREALVAANAWNFIQKIDTGLDTIVGGTGGSLSGGQKQRVAIARAFLKKPKILLLDEATSALDKVNEKIVQDAIDSYRKQRGNITIIVIAHRLTTIEDADKICVLENGVLTETGDHAKLMSLNGKYAEFVAKQAASEAGKKELTSEERKAEDEIVAEEPEDKDALKKTGTLQRTKTITDKSGRTISIKLDTAVSEKLNEADAKDEEWAKQVEEQLKPLKEKGDFSKIMEFNDPAWLIAPALVAVGAAGACQALFGWVFAEIMQLLTLPYDYLPFVYEKMDKTPVEVLQEETGSLCIYITIMAGILFVGYTGKSYIFAYLGENVTLKIRQLIYESILQKNIGWFDEQDNQSSVLTSVMASEAAILNGAASEALGPATEGFFALFGGLVIGFVFCWQESLITLGCVPFIIVSNVIAMEFEKGLQNEKGPDEKAANLIIGDAINNLKTVQSFGNEDKIVQAYVKLINKTYKKSTIKHIKAGLAYGLSQAIIYGIFAALFYFGGLVISESCEFNQETGEQVCSVNPKDVMIALFAIFFGASQAGTALSMGPDGAKAATAATKIFGIIEQPSKINAFETETDPTKKNLDPTTVKGKIEFKDVWFRYPTRKDDFVLKGLTLTIEPNESVALVGESGCGKSTFVSLLMRFYDPDFGTILLDGVDIQTYKIWDLRKALSLVMQEPSIFNYSIKDNILYGKLQAKNSEVVEAARISNSNEFIDKGSLDTLDDSNAGLLQAMQENKAALVSSLGQEEYDKQIDMLTKLKERDAKKGEFQVVEGDIDRRDAALKDTSLHKGYDIQCGLKGGKLSGGQKQRVAIARTLISQPKVLLLDEATSALDETSQKKVQEAIEAAMQNRTTIVIAHRMSTIKSCGKIFLLEEGRVKEEGNFDKLQAAGGAFAKLAQSKQE